MIAYHTDLLRQIESATNTYFEQLCTYLEANGKYPDWNDDPSLCLWILTQRYRYKAGELGEEMINELNRIGFIWNIKEAEWYDKAFLVKKLLKEDQAAFFSGRSAKLFRWLDENITRLRNNALQPGKIPVMKEIETLLSAVNLPATVRDTPQRLKRECIWMANFNDLVEFRKANPTTWPRINTTDQTERRLATWCIEMRYLYKKNNLVKDWIAKLETIAFNLNGKNKRSKS